MRIELASTIEAPAKARDFVRRHLAEATMPDRVPLNDVLIVVSELVTNGVRAGAVIIEIDIDATQQRFDVVVYYDGPGWPEIASPSPSAEQGRGLRIIESLADRWAVAARAPGKVVTATWFA